MISDKIISIAKSYIGEQEILGNKGFKDRGFQAAMSAAGWYMDASWCMFFAKMVWMQTYLGSLPYRKIDAKFTGSALGTYYNIAHDGTFQISLTPVPGAIVIFKEGTDPAKHEGHAGIVTERMGNQFKSIEGNTNAGADPNIREGYIVAEKIHILNQPPNSHGLNLVGFIIPNEL